MPRVGRRAQRALPVAEVHAVSASGGGRAIAAIAPCLIHGEPGHLRGARVFVDLREAGETCSKHRVARLMRENGSARYMVIAHAVGRSASRPC